jgi:hypothetical protein
MSVNGGNAEHLDSTSLERAAGRGPPIEVLPYRVGDSIDVLLVSDADRGAWRLLSAAKQKGLTRFASAALEVRRRFGVSGRVYKQPLRREGAGEASHVFPLLVQSDAPPPAGLAGAGAKWVSLGEASEVVSSEFRPVMAAFAARVSAGSHHSRSARAANRRR